MGEPMNTDKLRVAAQSWSLEGDRNLLNLLQNIHQNITSRCIETTKRVNEMVSTLDHAKVFMDNVNNRFMSLSNTQFVESRVYEDDSEFLTPSLTVKQPNAEETSIKSDPNKNLSAALLLLERNHERVVILDDSDSESDDGASVILRPKDFYQRRPLPFIIGSQSWKSKWHAGLIAEESDTESVVSKKEEDSSESDESIAMSEPNIHADANSFRSVSPASLPVQDDLYKPDMTRIYKPFGASNTAPQGYLFADEPPPIDTDTDATSIKTESDKDDIFSELHKDMQTNNFDKNNQSKNDENDIKNNVNKIANDKELSNDIEKSDSDIDINHNDNFDRNDTKNDNSSRNRTDSDLPRDLVEDKRPTGAVSLFGTKNAAESIGAAILKRNKKKSTSSEDDDERTNNQAKTNTKKHKNNTKDSNIPVNMKRSENIIRDINNIGENVIEQIVNKQNKGEKQVVVTEKNIFDELFAKSKEASKQTSKQSSKPIEEMKKDRKIDVFSDIFDDIDDMFTSDVKIDKKNNKSTKKSIFDDFVPENKDKRHVSKSIFEDNDDLFNETVNNTENINKEKSQKNIASDKIATEDQIFTNFTKDEAEKDDFTEKSMIFNSKDSDMFQNSEKKSESVKQTLHNTRKDNDKLLKRIFDSDSDDGDIFSVIKAPDLKKTEFSNKNSNIFGEIANSKSNSNFSEDELSTDKRANNPDFIIKNNKSIKYNENIKHKQTYLKEQDNSNSKTLFEKVTDKEVSHKLVSDTSVTNTVESNLEINEAEGLQHTANTLDKNLINNEDIQCNSAISNYDKVEVNNESTVFSSVYDIETTNTDKSHENDSIKEISSNVSETEIKDFLKTASKDINDLTHSQNDKNTSDIPKSINIQSKLNKSSEQITSNKDIKVDNVVYVEKDTFEDIFPEEPPDLEKAKDIKSNKNVNALFGDDSEDENLFFKKETLISDEKPDTTQVKPIDPLFGVFTDEPPDFDNDFLFNSPTHANQPGEPNKKVVNSNNKGNLFNSSPKANINVSVNTCIDKTKDTEKASIKTNFDTKETEKESIKTNLDTKDTEKESIKTNLDTKDIDSLFDSKPRKDLEETDGNTIESKSIGKLKPINFNINVTNLLPGASPKRIVKPLEHNELPFDVTSTDGGTSTKLTANETSSTNSNKDSIDKTLVYDQKDANLVKSVSFDSDPESTVLDSKISKERARIQVKRRPSTRKARKDAARKSVVDLIENIDDVECNFVNDLNISTQTAKEQVASIIDKNNSNIDIDIDNTNTEISKEYISIQTDTFLSRESKEKETYSNSYIEHNNTVNPINNAKKDFTKVLNKDETTLDNSKKDISKEEKVEQGLRKYTEKTSCSQIGTQVLNIIEDDIYIYREPKIQNYHTNTVQDALKTVKQGNIEKKSELEVDNIKTLHKIYHENTAQDVLKTIKKENIEKKSIFDDDDDVLFVGNTNSETLTKPSKDFNTSVFEDTSLFSRNNTKTQRNTESLFDDADNLFVKGNTEKYIPEVKKKTSVFDEENSELFSSGNSKPKLIKKTLFDDLSDDDDNLFGDKNQAAKKMDDGTKKSDLFTSKPNKMEQKLKTSLFDDDAEDLFGSTSKSKKVTESRLPKNEATKKIQDKMGDTDFEDPLSMLNNE